MARRRLPLRCASRPTFSPCVHGQAVKGALVFFCCAASLAPCKHPTLQAGGRGDAHTATQPSFSSLSILFLPVVFRVDDANNNRQKPPLSSCVILPSCVICAQRGDGPRAGRHASQLRAWLNERVRRRHTQQSRRSRSAIFFSRKHACLIMLSRRPRTLNDAEQASSQQSSHRTALAARCATATCGGRCLSSS